MKEKKTAKDTSVKKKSDSKKRMSLRVPAIILILLLLTTTGLLGYTASKQSSLLKENEKILTEAETSLDTVSEDAVSLQEEILSLKSALADYSPYLSEEDLTSADNLPQVPDADTADKYETDSSSNDSDDTDADYEEDETSSSLSYQKKYKKLYVSEKDSRQGKIVHLTFDDGPSQNTLKVLDILDRYDIKATFFVVYNDSEPACNYYKEIVKRGHTLAIHTASHNYKKIYASVDAFLEDFNKIYTYVYEQTGARPTLFRYPGGSTNCLSYRAGPAIMKEMERRGFIYYDWNVSSGDGGNQATRSSIYDWVTSKATQLDESVVLMHDSNGKAETVAALPSIIETLQDAGCIFEPLSPSTKPIQF